MITTTPRIWTPPPRQIARPGRRPHFPCRRRFPWRYRRTRSALSPLALHGLSFSHVGLPLFSPDGKALFVDTEGECCCGECATPCDECPGGCPPDTVYLTFSDLTLVGGYISDDPAGPAVGQWYMWDASATLNQTLALARTSPCEWAGTLLARLNYYDTDYNYLGAVLSWDVQLYYGGFDGGGAWNWIVSGFAPILFNYGSASDSPATCSPFSGILAQGAGENWLWTGPGYVALSF